MAVLKIEEYKQMNGVLILKVFLKPTKKFPNGYFYAPSEALSLVQNYTWFLCQHGNSIRIKAHTGDNFYGTTMYFYKELFRFYNGYDWSESIDHVNNVEIDNINDNLNAVSQQQNSFNKLTRSYLYSHTKHFFQPNIVVDQNNYCSSKLYREDITCIKQNYLEQVWLREKLGSDYYMFNFFKYRRGSEDILDLERTGQISEEEATYRHILRYKDNAWFYLRYGLEQYFKDYHIPVPKYSLDTEGFMVHPVTGQRLCPF